MGRLTDDYREYLLETLQKPREMAAYLDAALEQAFPRLPFLWPETSGGDDRVFLLTREQLSASC